MDVNESEPTRASPRRRRHLRLVLVVTLSIAIALLVGQFFVLPMLLRQQIMEALHEAGIDAVRFRVARATLWGAELADVAAGDGSVRIERIALDYSLGDLKQGRLDAIRILGATVRLGVRDGRFDLTPLRSLMVQRSSTSPAATRASGSVALPIRRIELVSSKVVLLTPTKEVDVPIGGSLIPQSDGRLSLSLQVGGEERAFVLGAEIKGEQATFAGSADPGRTLLIVRAIWPDADVSADGTLKVAGNVDWHDQTAGNARLEILNNPGTAAGAPNDAKLHLSAGVYEVAARFGDTNNSPPAIQLKISRAAFAVADQGLSASGIDGNIAISSLVPLTTPLKQTLTADELKKGDMVFKNGILEIQMLDSSKMLVQHTQWKWLGGDVWADNFVISGEPLNITLHARDVQLTDLLALTANDKASGQGKLSGDIPVIIDGSNIQFGTGSFSAASGGNVQIKDMNAIAPTAEAVAQSMSTTNSDQIKKNVIEALSDFQYDTLSMSLEKNATGLIGHVHMKGRGRSGAKQPLDYELNVTGLDKVLRGYLRIREGLDAPHVATTAATTTTKAAK